MYFCINYFKIIITVKGPTLNRARPFEVGGWRYNNVIFLRETFQVRQLKGEIKTIMTQ